MDAIRSAGYEDPQAVARQLDQDLGVSEWWTPVMPRRPEPAVPRVTEEGLKVPSWWADEETESQLWLSSQGVNLG